MEYTTEQRRALAACYTFILNFNKKQIGTRPEDDEVNPQDEAVKQEPKPDQPELNVAQSDPV